MRKRSFVFGAVLATLFTLMACGDARNANELSFSTTKSVPMVEIYGALAGRDAMSGEAPAFAVSVASDDPFVADYHLQIELGSDLAGAYIDTVQTNTGVWLTSWSVIGTLSGTVLTIDVEGNPAMGYQGCESFGAYHHVATIRFDQSLADGTYPADILSLTYEAHKTGYDPVIVSTTGGQLVVGGPRVLETTLPRATASRKYFALIQTWGLQEPLTIEHISGILPDGYGFRLGGVSCYSGIPAQEGEYEFELKITDANQFSLTETFSLVVEDLPAELTSAQLVTDTDENRQYSAGDVLELTFSEHVTLSSTPEVTFTLTGEGATFGNNPSFKLDSYDGRVVRVTLGTNPVLHLEGCVSILNTSLITTGSANGLLDLDGNPVESVDGETSILVVYERELNASYFVIGVPFGPLALTPFTAHAADLEATGLPEGLSCLAHRFLHRYPLERNSVTTRFCTDRRP